MSHVHECIGKHVGRLLLQHNNLSIIKVSPIKTSAYSGSDVCVTGQTCIVFYVPVKGIIPFGEDEFEKQIEGIPTDIREGEFVYFGRHKAHTYQPKLRMGCLISTEDRQTGTIGGFVDLPNNKIGFITSAHVVLNEKEMREFKDSGIVGQHEFNKRLENGEKEICICQPNLKYPKVGIVYQICIEPGNEKNASVDAAIIEMTDDNRIPDSGEFPVGKFTHIGFTKDEPMLFTSGEIQEEILNAHKGSLVIKYGGISGITRGCLNWTTVYARKVDMYEKLPFSLLYSQILVMSSDDGVSFASHGDSGALVFLCTGGNLDNLKVIGMVEGGSTNLGSGCMHLVIPIKAIFEKLGFKKSEFKCFLDSEYAQQQGTAVAQDTDSEQTERTQKEFEERLTKVENAMSRVTTEISEMKTETKSLMKIMKEFYDKQDNTKK